RAPDGAVPRRFGTGLRDPGEPGQPLAAAAHAPPRRARAPRAGVRGALDPHHAARPAADGGRAHRVAGLCLGRRDGAARAAPGRGRGFGRPWFEWSAFSEQFRHSAPLGLNSAFYGLRGNADQWVAASLFSLTSFAAFSVAAVVGQLVHILRLSVMEACLPSMSRLQAAADVRGMLDMNSRGNVLVGKLLYPALAFVFAFAPELVTLVYTASYADAAPVMRVYAFGMVASAVEMGSLVMLLRQGPYALGVTACTLAVSVAVSWVAAHFFGLTGAAAGSVLALYLDRVLILRRVAGQTGIAFGKLQDWRTLALQLALAAFSG